jgi:hypothetical protein
VITGFMSNGKHHEHAFALDVHAVGCFECNYRGLAVFAPVFMPVTMASALMTMDSIRCTCIGETKGKREQCEDNASDTTDDVAFSF